MDAAPSALPTQKVTVNKLELRPGVWRLKTNTSTYDPKGKRISRDEAYATFRGTEEQAELERYRLLLGLGVSQKTRDALEPTAATAAEGLTVGQYAEQWLARRLGEALEGQTASSYKKRIRYYVLPAWGRYRLATLTRDQIVAGAQSLLHHTGERAALEGAGRAIAPRTVRTAMTLLGSILLAANEAGLTPSKAGDMKRAKEALPRVAAKGNAARAKALSDEQTAHLLRTVRSHVLGPAIRLALATGCRRGELCALTWSGVAFDPKGGDTAVITVTQSMADDGHKAWLKAPKSDESTRSIAVSGAIVEELREMHAQAEAITAQLGGDTGARPVLLNAWGSHYKPNSLSDVVRPLMRDAGLAAFTLHCLRHTHASTLLRCGMNISAVSARLGHSDPGFTLRVYSWAMPSEDARLAETMAAAMGGRSTWRASLEG